MQMIDRLKALTAQVKNDIKNIGAKIGDITTLKTTAKSDLTVAVNELADNVSAIISKTGDLTLLSTADKSSLVNAINELSGIVQNATGIDDTAGDGVTNKTWSADKIGDTILSQLNALETKLTNGAGGALDTFKELADALNNNPNFASELATTMANMVRVDTVQTFTQVEKTQACNNIGIGDPDTDLVAYYNSI